VFYYVIQWLKDMRPPRPRDPDDEEEVVDALPAHGPRGDGRDRGQHGIA